MKWVILISIFLSGCVTKERCLRRFPPSTSTIITKVVRDTIVIVKVDEILLFDTVYLETLTPLTIEKNLLITEFCLGQAWVYDSKLFHTLQQRPVEKEIVIKEAIKEVEVIKEIVITKKVNELTWWQQTRLKLINWLLIGGVIYLGISKRKIIWMFIKKVLP